MIAQHLKLCLVTHIQNQSIEKYLHFLKQAILGGVTAVQLREKNHDIEATRHMALSLQSILHPLKIPLIINDHVQLAKEIDADGVHLGQSDIHPNEAREILGPDKIIGLSVETLTELKRANQLKTIDYIAASAVFQSQTKLNCKTYWGIHGLTELVKISQHPVIAIGGINLSNIQPIFESGVTGVAVVSAIHNAKDPNKTASDFIHIIHQLSNKEIIC